MSHEKPVQKNIYFQYDLFVVQKERKLTPRKKQNKDLTKLTNQTVFILELTFEAPVLFHINILWGHTIISFSLCWLPIRREPFLLFPPPFLSLSLSPEQLNSRPWVLNQLWLATHPQPSAPITLQLQFLYRTVKYRSVTWQQAAASWSNPLTAFALRGFFIAWTFSGIFPRYTFRGSDIQVFGLGSLFSEIWGFPTFWVLDILRLYLYLYL